MERLRIGYIAWTWNTDWIGWMGNAVYGILSLGRIRDYGFMGHFGIGESW